MFNFLRNFLSRNNPPRKEQPRQPSSEEGKEFNQEIERLKGVYKIDSLREQYIRSYLIYKRKEYRKIVLYSNFGEIIQIRHNLAKRIGIGEREIEDAFSSVQNQVSKEEKPEGQGQEKQQQEQGQEQSETEEKNPKDVFIDNLIRQHGDKLNQEIAGAIFDLLSDLRTYENNQKSDFQLQEKIARLDVEIDKFKYDKAKIEVAKEYFQARLLEAQNTNAEFNETQVESEILTDLVIREMDLVREAEVEKWPPEKKKMMAKIAAPVVALLDRYLKLNPTVRLVFSTSAVAILSGALGVIPVSAVPGIFLLRLGRSALATGVSLFIGKTIESTWGKRIRAKKEEGIRDILGLANKDDQEIESGTQQEELSSSEELRVLMEEASGRYEQVIERFRKQERWKTFTKGLAMAITGPALSYALSSYFSIPGPESIKTAHAPSVSPEHTSGVQAPSEHTTIPEHQGVTGQTDTGMETKTPLSPATEVIPPETQSKVFTWKFGNLNPLEVHQVSPDQVEIAGQNYSLTTHNGSQFIEVPYDANHDGLPDGKYKALIDPKTGRGIVEIGEKKIPVYAYDKDIIFKASENRFGLVARSHIIVDITGDGKVEPAVWVDKEGVHLSHDLNPEGLSINGQPYEEWIKSNSENIQNINIFDLDVKFEKFVPDPSRVDLNDPESVAEDLARQIAAVDPNNYEISDNKLIIKVEKFEQSKMLWEEYLRKKFILEHNFYSEIQSSNGLDVKKFHGLREDFEKWAIDQQISTEHTSGVQAPSEHTTIPEHQGVTGQTDTGMETKTPLSPATEVIPPETQSKVFTWKFGNLNPLEVHQVSPDQVEIAGQNYSLTTHNGSQFIEVPYDANHDGLPDGKYKALIDPKTGRGIVEIGEKKIPVYAYDKDIIFKASENRFGLVARSHIIVDITGDGKVEPAVWVDKEGVHLSHDLNPEGLSINGQPYEEWIKSNSENIQNINIFDLDVKFEKFVPDPSRVDLNDPESVAEDLARQIAAVDPNNYEISDNKLIIKVEKFEQSKMLWEEYLRKKFILEHNFYSEIQSSNGLDVKKFHGLREDFEKWAIDQQISTHQGKENVMTSEPVVKPKTVVAKGSLGEKGVGFNIESKESLPTINVEVGETNIPYIDPYAPEKYHTLTVVKTPDNHIKINYDGRTIGEGFIRQSGTFYIEYTIREGDPEAVRAFNAARANLIRAAERENMTPYILFRVDDVILKSEISGIDNNLKDALNDLIYKSDKNMDQVINELSQMIQQGTLNENQFVAYYTGMLSKIFQIREFDPELSSNIKRIFSELKSTSPYDQTNAINQLKQLVSFLKFK